jgi:hypothetical protein
MVHSLVYVSAADRALRGVDLQTLLEQSRSHNRANDITGLLLYRAGTFLQFIEGDEAVVEDLYTVIEADERHHDVTVVRRRTQPVRQFPSWSMAYGDVDPTSTDPVQVESPPPDGPAPQTVDEARFILELLDLFDPRIPDQA